MRAAVIVFPGSNCDRDLAGAFARVGGRPAEMVWHKEPALPAGLDVVGVPGGFSYGDYLRCGAIAARSPIMRAVAEFARRGGLVLGVCNGWQVLIEAELLPGALLRNHGVTFLCQDVTLRAETRESPFTASLPQNALLRMPIAHHDGAFFAEAEILRRIESDGRVAFRYADAAGHVDAGSAPNGSTRAIAGVLSENRRVLGMMPHPERAVDPALGQADGALLFESVAAATLANAPG
ncbi:MAG: phosphoribosylformylglycinamidine synthase subunit PurQ [Pseudomonadota bacterium]